MIVLSAPKDWPSIDSLNISRKVIIMKYIEVRERGITKNADIYRLVANELKVYKINKSGTNTFVRGVISDYLDQSGVDFHVLHNEKTDM